MLVVYPLPAWDADIRNSVGVDCLFRSKAFGDASIKINRTHATLFCVNKSPFGSGGQVISNEKETFGLLGAICLSDDILLIYKT